MFFTPSVLEPNPGMSQVKILKNGLTNLALGIKPSTQTTLLLRYFIFTLQITFWSVVRWRIWMACMRRKLTAEAAAARAAAKKMSTPSPSLATTETKPMLGAVVSRSSSARNLQSHTVAPMSNEKQRISWNWIRSALWTSRQGFCCCRNKDYRVKTRTRGSGARILRLLVVTTYFPVIYHSFPHF